MWSVSPLRHDDVITCRAALPTYIAGLPHHDRACGVDGSAPPGLGPHSPGACLPPPPVAVAGEILVSALATEMVPCSFQAARTDTRTLC